MSGLPLSAQGTPSLFNETPSMVPPIRSANGTPNVGHGSHGSRDASGATFVRPADADLVRDADTLALCGGMKRYQLLDFPIAPVVKMSLRPVHRPRPPFLVEVGGAGPCGFVMDVIAWSWRASFRAVEPHSVCFVEPCPGNGSMCGPSHSVVEGRRKGVAARSGLHQVAASLLACVGTSSFDWPCTCYLSWSW